LNPENNPAIELALNEALLVARYFYLGGATRIGRIIPVVTMLASEHIGSELLQSKFSGISNYD